MLKLATLWCNARTKQKIDTFNWHPSRKHGWVIHDSVFGTTVSGISGCSNVMACQAPWVSLEYRPVVELKALHDSVLGTTISGMSSCSSVMACQTPQGVMSLEHCPAVKLKVLWDLYRMGPWVGWLSAHLVHIELYPQRYECTLLSEIRIA